MPPNPAAQYNALTNAINSIATGGPADGLTVGASRAIHAGMHPAPRQLACDALLATGVAASEWHELLAAILRDLEESRDDETRAQAAGLISALPAAALPTALAQDGLHRRLVQCADSHAPSVRAAAYGAMGALLVDRHVLRAALAGGPCANAVDQFLEYLLDAVLDPADVAAEHALAGLALVLRSAAARHLAASSPSAHEAAGALQAVGLPLTAAQWQFEVTADGHASREAIVSPTCTALSVLQGAFAAVLARVVALAPDHQGTAAGFLSALAVAAAILPAAPPDPGAVQPSATDHLALVPMCLDALGRLRRAAVSPAVTELTSTATLRIAEILGLVPTPGIVDLARQQRALDAVRRGGLVPEAGLAHVDGGISSLLRLYLSRSAPLAEPSIIAALCAHPALAIHKIATLENCAPHEAMVRLILAVGASLAEPNERCQALSELLFAAVASDVPADTSVPPTNLLSKLFGAPELRGILSAPRAGGYVRNVWAWQNAQNAAAPVAAAPAASPAKGAKKGDAQGAEPGAPEGGGGRGEGPTGGGDLLPVDASVIAGGDAPASANGGAPAAADASAIARGGPQQREPRVPRGIVGADVPREMLRAELACLALELLSQHPAASLSPPRCVGEATGPLAAAAAEWLHSEAAVVLCRWAGVATRLLIATLPVLAWADDVGRGAAEPWIALSQHVSWVATRLGEAVATAEATAGAAGLSVRQRQLAEAARQVRIGTDRLLAETLRLWDRMPPAARPRLLWLLSHHLELRSASLATWQRLSRVVSEVAGMAADSGADLLSKEDIIEAARLGKMVNPEGLRQVARRRRLLGLGRGGERASRSRRSRTPKKARGGKRRGKSGAETAAPESDDEAMMDVEDYGAVLEADDAAHVLLPCMLRLAMVTMEVVREEASASMVGVTGGTEGGARVEVMRAALSEATARCAPFAASSPGASHLLYQVAQVAAADPNSAFSEEIVAACGDLAAAFSAGDVLASPALSSTAAASPAMAVLRQRTLQAIGMTHRRHLGDLIGGTGGAAGKDDAVGALAELVEAAPTAAWSHDAAEHSRAVAGAPGAAKRLGLALAQDLCGAPASAVAPLAGLMQLGGGTLLAPLLCRGGQYGAAAETGARVVELTAPGDPVVVSCMHEMAPDLAAVRLTIKLKSRLTTEVGGVSVRLGLRGGWRTLQWGTVPLVWTAKSLPPGGETLFEMTLVADEPSTMVVQPTLVLPVGALGPSAASAAPAKQGTPLPCRGYTVPFTAFLQPLGHPLGPQGFLTLWPTLQHQAHASGKTPPGQRVSREDAVAALERRAITAIHRARLQSGAGFDGSYAARTWSGALVLAKVLVQELATGELAAGLVVKSSSAAVLASMASEDWVAALFEGLLVSN
ncbi:unnamed protein product [Pedinophyceae sp. YPF-701]|nr:unnamed protein product [Pedinophyceae sp. YPF-701]